MRRRSLRDVRDVAFLQPYQLPFVVAVVIVALVFTVFPEALEHSPIAFEERGFIHHVWHYTLLSGGLLTLWAMVWAHPNHRIQAEIIGLTFIATAVVINLIALITTQFVGPESEQASGIAIAIRAALLTGMSIRVFVLICEPTVQVSIEPRREG